MPDTINKQTLINLLIDSPLREPIKINLIDIINNTTEPDLPKVFPTIVKELEIFQKATERRMKLADETISKLGGVAPASTDPTQPLTTNETPSAAPLTPPPLDLPPLPTLESPVLEPVAPATAPVAEPVAPPVVPTTPLSVPPLDLPPLPTVSAPIEPAMPASPLPSPEPLGGAVATPSSDEAALAEIQKELESLKAGVAADAAQTTPPTAPQS
ncbi:hypothetical protein KBD69_03465 [Candidatus Woesebacteria bacterium]|nr:hypothetical protein [Candidatus Woesebacteria bacterium]